MKREITSFWSSANNCFLIRANHWGPKGHSSKTFASHDHTGATLWLDAKDREK